MAKPLGRELSSTSMPVLSMKRCLLSIVASLQVQIGGTVSLICDCQNFPRSFGVNLGGRRETGGEARALAEPEFDRNELTSRFCGVIEEGSPR